MKKDIIFIGYIDKKISSGPAVALNNILNQFKLNGTNIKFINTCSNNILYRLKLLKDIIMIMIIKDSVINVHSFGYKIPYYIYLISKINKKNKYFLTMHGILSEQAKYVHDSETYKEFFNDAKKYNKIEKELIQNFPNIICVSNGQKVYLEEKYNRKNNVYVIYNGTNIPNIYKLHELNFNKVKLIMAGGIYKVKNIFLLLQFIKEYNEKNLNSKVYMDICGGYESLSILKDYNDFINKNELMDYISYKGILDKQKLNKLYAESHFCVALSKFDTFNLTAIESMSYSTPAIVSKQCGISEVLKNGINGYVLDLNDNTLNCMSDIVENLVLNPEEYKKVSINAYQTSLDFSCKNIYDMYFNLFNNI